MFADLQRRLRAAATRLASLWIAAAALFAGASAAYLAVLIAPRSGTDVAAAKSLGIVSVSILADHSKSAESVAYGLALFVAIAVSLTIWIVWAMQAGKATSLTEEPVTWQPVRVPALELLIVALLSFALFARFWNGRAATFSSWSALDEEGEMMAWVDTVLRGDALSRDVFCLYGPLSTWPVAALFALLKPSLGLWRMWIFALNAPAVIAAYLLLRGITRTRLAAAAGAIALGLCCAPAIPAMSWSLSRVGFGLATLATLTRALDRNKKGWWITVGVLLGASLIYSQEVGIASSLAAAAVLLFGANERLRSLVWTLIGAALVLVPTVVYLGLTNALWPTIENLFLFPRVRMLGFAAIPFPRPSLEPQSLRAYFVPVVLVVSAFCTATKLLRGSRDGRVLTEVALFIFGALLFSAALSRPDDTHFAFVMPPALMLLVGLLENAAYAIRLRQHRITATAAFALGVLAMVPWSSVAKENFVSLVQPPTGRVLALPRGGSALFPEDFAHDLEGVTHAIQARTEPNESFWVFPNEALLYFLAERPQPTYFPLALFAVTREQREQLVNELARTRPRWAVVYRDAAPVDGIPYAVALPEVMAYLIANYEPEENFGSFTLVRRKN